MSKLTGLEILKQVKEGNIIINPFDQNCINPNSYNLHLGNTLKIYKKTAHNVILDAAQKEFEMEEFQIPDDGFVLEPGTLYLGTAEEWTETDKYVPQIDGRSSTGRLGLTVHMTAGFGDIGFKGRWTLEIFVIHPIRIYAGLEIAQISYQTVEGDTGYLYNGRYQGQQTVVESRIGQEKKGAFNGNEA